MTVSSDACLTSANPPCEMCEVNPTASLSLFPCTAFIIIGRWPSAHHGVSWPFWKRPHPPSPTGDCPPCRCRCCCCLSVCPRLFSSALRLSPWDMAACMFPQPVPSAASALAPQSHMTTGGKAPKAQCPARSPLLVWRKSARIILSRPHGFGPFLAPNAATIMLASPAGERTSLRHGGEIF